MATPQSSQPDEVLMPHYPSYEALQHENLLVRPSPDAAQRLFWPLDGPLSTSISIMKDSWSPDSLEPYFQQTTGGADTWHAVSQSPLTEPMVSSITVSVYDLELWEDSWLEEHEEHSSPDGGDEDEPSAQYGALPDPDPEKMEDGSEHLLMCCNEARPRGKAAKLVVKPAAAGNGIVTVHDYVSAVHPWLMSLRADILKAMAVLDQPVPLVTELMVNSNGPEQLMIEDKEEWIKQRRK